jgi:hypothetical protein
VPCVLPSQASFVLFNLFLSQTLCPPSGRILVICLKKTGINDRVKKGFLKLLCERRFYLKHVQTGTSAPFETVRIENILLYSFFFFNF